VKKFVYLFILLSFFGYKHTNAKTGDSFALQQLSELHKYENTLKEKSSTDYFTIKNSKISKKLRPSKRKKYQKGIVTVHYFCAAENTFLIHLGSNQFIFSSQTFYFLQLFFGNEKRGPPVLSIS